MVESAARPVVAPRSVLGAADVEDVVLAAMVAAQLGVDEVELLESQAEVAPYDVEALTTAGRYWVRGTARTQEGTSAPFSFFVKVVQSWARSPLFRFVPEDQREIALSMVPWRTEPAIYRSDLAARLPDGLSLPTSYGVIELDEMSAAVWLGEVDVQPVTWDQARHERAAYLLGRLAASPAVGPLAGLSGRGADGRTVRDYANGRVATQVLPGLRDHSVWQHPLVAGAFDERLHDDLLRCADALPGHLDELDTMPGGTSHGDACTRNLLVSSDRDDAFVLIDFGFWGRAPLGFDLGQLLLGEVQMGERPAGCLPALEAGCLPSYVRGLRDEGNDADQDVVRRSHALLMLLFAGLSALPFEHLDREPTPDLLRIARERAASARFIVDLVDATAP